MGQLQLFGEPEDGFSGDHADLSNVTADQHHAQLHKAGHLAGGGDAFAAGDLLDATARVAVRKNSGGADVGARRRLNLIEGSNITLTVADDPAGEEVAITIAASDGGGGLLAYTVYNPGTAETKSTSSGTFVDADATNLKVTFTAPSSGKVLIRVSAVADNSGSAVEQYWNLRDAGGDVAGTAAGVWQGPELGRPAFVTIVTGLTPGNSYTYKLGFRRVGTGTAYIYIGGDYGAFVMEVWPVP